MSERIGLHSLKPASGSRKPRKRIGRGGGSGTGKTAGRGHKGAGARSGNRRRVRFEGGQTQPVNLDDLDARFDAGAEVTPDALREQGLATKRDVPVKVLGRGELSKALTVHAHGFSKAAREKVEAAGGTCQLIEG